MPTAAYNTQKNARGNKPAVTVEISGIPIGWTSADRVKFTSHAPPYLTASQYKRYIEEIPSITSERVDLVRGETEFGSATVRIVDISDYATDVFDTSKAKRIGKITADLNRTETRFNVTNSASFVVNTNYFIGGETVRVQAVNAVPNTIDVYARGAHGSEAERHWKSLAYEAHDDNLYDRPPTMRGREIRIYYEWDDSAAVSADRLLRFAGIIDDIRLVDDLNTWEIEAKSGVAGARGMCCGRIFRGRLIREGGFPGEAVTEWLLQADRGAPGFSGDGRIQIGDEIIAVDAELSTADGYNAVSLGGSDPLESRYLNTSIPALGEANYIEPGTRAFDVLWSDDRVDPNSAYTLGWLKGAAPPTTRVKNSHPLVIFLNLLCSTYDQANYDSAFSDGAGGVISFDAIGLTTTSQRGRNFGLGYPAARINFQSFWDAMHHSGVVNWRMRRAAIPDGGDAFRLLEWFYENLAPFLGVFLVTDSNGKLACRINRDIYPFDSATAIGAADILPGSLSVDMVLGRTTSRLAVRYVDESFQERSFVANNDQMREFFPVESTSIELDATNYDADMLGRVERRAYRIAFDSAFPRMEVSMTLGWNRHDLVIGDVIQVTHAQLPDVGGGDRGLTGRAMLVTEVDAEADEAEVRVKAIMPPRDTNLGHVAPSGDITAWNAGLKTATLSANAYTDASGPAGTPTKDANGFTVNDYVVLQDEDGVLVSDNAVQVTAIGTNQVTVDVVFKSGGVDVAQATVEQSILIFRAYDATVSGVANMTKFVFLADESTGTLGATSDAAYKHGD